METIKHSTLNLNAINMHVAETGPTNGPMVLFIHGFPESWYSWRHQMVALAAHGYHAVAPDLRGYGDTDVPPKQESYTVHHVVGDLVALIQCMVGEEEKVFVVGHDWGAYMAWFLCLFRPDKVKALVNLSVVYIPRNPKMSLIQAVRALYGDDYYMCRFQEPGDIEAEFQELGTENVLKGFFSLRYPGPLYFPKGKALFDKIELPPWLTEEDLKHYVNNFEKKGFTGGLNYYRNLDRNWELTAPWTGSKVTVPVKFVVGDLDLTYNSMGSKEYIDSGNFKKDVPLLEEVVVMEGVAHFINQEKAEEISKHIHSFIMKF